MVLDQLITKFRDLSGRYDMTDEDIIDLLDAGQRYLDDKTELIYAPKRLIRSITQGAYTLALGMPTKVVQKIKFVNLSSTIAEIEVVEFDKLMFADELAIGSRPEGLPRFVSIAPITKNSVSGTIPASIVADMGITTSYADTLLVFENPVDTSYLVDIAGKFYHGSFYSVDETWWSLHYPMTLVQSALYQLEIGYRNTSGANDWLMAMNVTLKELLDNAIEEEIFNINQIGG